jgi:hypothetical protein
MKEEVKKRIAKKLKYYSWEQFEKDARTYISAIQESRMCCVIHSVSSSGMSRVMSFHSCEESSYEPSRFNYRQYNCLFIALGYTEDKKRNGFRIGGCGMDLIFHTNYCIIYNFHALGFLSIQDRNTLCQKTPTVL